METHKNWKIEKADYEYYEAVNLKDCDAYMKYSRNIDDLKAEIDEEEIERKDKRMSKHALTGGFSFLLIPDVVVPKGTCCLKPEKIGKVNDMFESWDECKNCGKEVL